RVARADVRGGGRLLDRDVRAEDGDVTVVRDLGVVVGVGGGRVLDQAAVFRRGWSRHGDREAGAARQARDIAVEASNGDGALGLVRVLRPGESGRQRIVDVDVGRSARPTVVDGDREADGRSG